MFTLEDLIWRYEYSCSGRRNLILCFDLGIHFILYDSEYNVQQLFAAPIWPAQARTHLAENEESRVIIDINNVHKTYLLGIEGVPALRYCFRPRRCRLLFSRNGLFFSLQNIIHNFAFIILYRLQRSFGYCRTRRVCVYFWYLRRWQDLLAEYNWHHRQAHERRPENMRHSYVSLFCSMAAK